MEVDVNNLLSQITQDDRTEKLCKLLTDLSLATGQSGLINQIENLKPQATYYDTTDKKIIEPIKWTQNPSARAEDEIRQIAESHGKDSNLYLDETGARVRHCLGIKKNSTLAELDDILENIKNGTQKWIVCLSTIRASFDEEKRCLVYETNKVINWDKSLKRFNALQGSRRYSENTRLVALRDLATYAMPQSSLYFESLDLKSIDIYLRGLTPIIPEKILYRELLQTYSRLVDTQFVTAYKGASELYKKYRGETLRPTANANMNDIEFDHGLFTFSYHCVKQFCIPSLANSLCKYRDDQISLGKKVDFKKIIEAITKFEHNQDNRPKVTMILNWSQGENIQILNTSLNKPEHIPQKFGLTEEFENFDNLPEDQFLELSYEKHIKPAQSSRGEKPKGTKSTQNNVSKQQYVPQQQNVKTDQAVYENVGNSKIEDDISKLNRVRLPTLPTNILLVSKNIRYFENVRQHMLETEPIAWRDTVENIANHVRSEKPRHPAQQDLIDNTTKYIYTHYKNLNPETQCTLGLSTQVNNALETHKEDLLHDMIKSNIDEKIVTRSGKVTNHNTRISRQDQYSRNRERFRTPSINRYRNMRTPSRDRQRDSYSNSYKQYDTYNKDKQYSRTDRDSYTDRKRYTSPYRRDSYSRQQSQSPYRQNDSRRQSRSYDRQTGYNRQSTSPFNSRYRKQSRSPYKNQTGYKYDNYRNRTDNKDNNRNPSFDRLSRNQNRSDSNSRYKDRDNQYVRNRSSSRSKNNRTFTREPTPKRVNNRYRSRERSLEIRNKYPDLKYGYNTPYSYNPLEQKFCLKCSFEPNVKVKTHHFFDCRKFMQHNPDICDNCHRGNHMNEECTKKNGYFTKGQNKSVSYLN